MGGKTGEGEPALRLIRFSSIALLAVVCIVVALITFSPGPPDPAGQQALRSFLRYAHLHGLPWWISFNKIEFGANILMFIPIGLFGALALPKHRWLVMPAAVLGSLAIEITQASGLPQRVGTPRDVIANSLGAVIGYLLACLVIWYVNRGARRRDAYEWLASIHPQPATLPPVDRDS
jgi:glycopeptide antibiotics resistance protein